MVTFFEGTWEIVLQISAALGVLAAIFGSLYVIITKFGWFNGIIQKRQIKKRLESCPQKAVCDLARSHQNEQIMALLKLLEKMQSGILMAQGGLIAIHCTMAIQRGYLPLYDRTWLQNAFDEYTAAGGNHGVERLFNEAMALQDTPPKSRRCTDTKNTIV